MGTLLGLQEITAKKEVSAILENVPGCGTGKSAFKIDARGPTKGPSDLGNNFLVGKVGENGVVRYSEFLRRR